MAEDKTTEAPVQEATKPAVKPAKATPKKAPAGGKVAIIRVRNLTQCSGAVRDTMKMLRMHKKFTCVIVESTPSILGMVTKVKDFVAYGNVSDETIKLLEEKRGTKNKEGKMNNYFHLHPPRGGFERKGIKRSFNQGGAIGPRGEKINDLIKKMI